MRPLWKSRDIAQATGGEELGSFEATGLSIDTRSLVEGDLFVPLRDARDGHDFIATAMKAGAAGTLTEVDIEGPAIKVKDTLQALGSLGRAGRDRSAAHRVAVTGSVGKTSVKDALAVMLTAFGETHKSARSFNNHLGVPITLATLPQSAEFAVFETGMNHSGELLGLSKQVAPHVALITNVAGAHQANFDSIEAIADAKAEICHGLVEGGVLILNADNAHTPRIREQADGHQIKTFGTGRDCDVAIVASNHHASGGNVRLRVEGQQIDVTLAVSGQHWDYNAAACIAVALALGLDLRKAARALRDVRASDGRGDVHSISINGKSVTLIDESYNANPTSMRAALSAAALRSGRKIAVLGDMYELGPDELEQHAALADPLVKAGFARVLTLGECMRTLRGALPRNMRSMHADTTDLIEESLHEELQDGDVLLIKGSNATGLGRLAARLKGEGAR